MTDARGSWEEVGKVLEGLGLKLKLHAQKARDELGGDEGKEIGDALKDAAAKIDQAFDALGKAVRDQAVQDDVKRAGTALSDAITNTFNEAVSNIKAATRRTTE